MSDLSATYEAWMNAPTALVTRTIAAVAVIAHRVLVEASTTDARRAWALVSATNPGRDAEGARWFVVTSTAFVDGAITDDAILAAVADAVDALATTAP